MSNWFDEDMIARREGTYSLITGLLALVASATIVFHLQSKNPQNAALVTLGTSAVSVFFGIIGIYLSREAACGDKKARARSILGLCMSIVSLAIVGVWRLSHG